MLLCLHNRNGQVKLLKTDKADKVINVTENKINSITGVFFLKYYLDLGATAIVLLGNFFCIFLK